MYEDRARLRFFLRLILILGLVVGFALLLRGLRLADVARALRGALLWPVVVAAIVNFLQIGWKAACWRVMLAPAVDLPMTRIFRYTIAAFTASALTPARAGEMVRIWLLQRCDGVPLPALAAVAIGEKVLDAIAMLIVIAPLPWLLPGLPAWILRTSIGLFAVGAAFVVGCRWAMTWRSAPRWLRAFLEGLTVLRQPKTFLLALTTLVAAWLTDLLEVCLVLLAVGLHLPLGAGLLILFTMNLAIAVPSTPAHIGALEIGALVALDFLGVPRAQALAFALLYHAMQIVPLLVVGLLDHRFVVSAINTRTSAQRTSG